MFKRLFGWLKDSSETSQNPLKVFLSQHLQPGTDTVFASASENATFSLLVKILINLTDRKIKPTLVPSKRTLSSDLDVSTLIWETTSVLLSGAWLSTWLRELGEESNPMTPGLTVADTLILDGLDDPQRQEILAESVRRLKFIFLHKNEDLQTWNQTLGKYLISCALEDSNRAHAGLVEHLCYMRFFIYPVVLAGAEAQGIQGSPELRFSGDPEALLKYASMDLTEALCNAASNYNPFTSHEDGHHPKDGFFWLGVHFLSTKSGPSRRRSVLPEPISLRHIEAEILLVIIPFMIWRRTHGKDPTEGLSEGIIKIANNLMEAYTPDGKRESITGPELVSALSTKADNMLLGDNRFFLTWADNYSVRFALCLEDPKWLPHIQRDRDIYFFHLSITAGLN